MIVDFKECAKCYAEIPAQDMRCPCGAIFCDRCKMGVLKKRKKPSHPRYKSEKVCTSCGYTDRNVKSIAEVTKEEGHQLVRDLIIHTGANDETVSRH